MPCEDAQQTCVCAGGEHTCGVPARRRGHIRAHVQSVRSPGKRKGGATSTLSDAHLSPASEHEHTQMSNKGVVKAVLSCDTIIVVGVPQVRTASYVSRSPGRGLRVYG
jgi:hypothetical protein